MVNFEICRGVDNLISLFKHPLKCAAVEDSSLKELPKAVKIQKDSSRRIKHASENSRSDNNFPRPAIFWVAFPASLSIPTAFDHRVDQKAPVQ